MKPEDKEYIVSEAFDSYPVAPLPEGFVANLLEQIEPKPIWQRGLAWLEGIAFLPTALSIFFSGFFLLVLGSGWWAISKIDPLRLHLLLRKLRYWKLWGSLRIIPGELSSGVYLGLAAVVLVLLLSFTWVLTDPRRRHPVYS